MNQEVYRIRRPDVVSEAFDGEAVVVNLRLGRYYAFTPLASEVWERLAASPALGELVESALPQWSDPAVAERELRTFLKRLEEEELIELAPPPNRETVPFEPLAARDDATLDFEIFTDLEDLLVLDPIHDLDENGWPVADSSSVSDAAEK